jgi:outer membrane protein assembly factor BamB
MLRHATISFLLTASFAFAVGAADPGEELLAAAKKGDAEAVKALLEKGADVNFKNAYGATALTFAADKGHVAVVKVLLQNKANASGRDTFYHMAPLDWAVSRGHIEIVKALLESEAEGAGTALQSAAAAGSLEMVKTILEAGKPKEEALTKALAVTPAEQTAIADLLQKAGARPTPKSDVKVDADVLASYAGTYRGDDALALKVSVSDGNLTFQAGTEGAIKLNPIDKVSFKTDEGSATVTFHREGNSISHLTLKAGTKESIFRRTDAGAEPDAPTAPIEDKGGLVKEPLNWPSFRGPHAAGIADGQFPPLFWDVDKGVNIRWKTPIPGLGLSCPIVWGERIYLTTAVSADGKAELKPGLYGDVSSVDEPAEQTWSVLCIDKRSGKILWQQAACKGVPKVKRHAKSSHANPTPATDGAHVVASFGSEGLYCFDSEGKLLWDKGLGVLNAGWFYDADYQWGFGSSPIIHKNLVIVQCDVGKDSFLAAYQVSDGKEVWRTAREEIPSWGTPTIVDTPSGIELVTNASKFARGYDPMTGQELWRLGRHSEITVPTPVFGEGLIFIASGYRPVQPIYAIRPGAAGDISLKEGKTDSDAVAWSIEKGGPYMTTPIVYLGHLYICSNAGVVTCYEARTGKQIYKERLGSRGGYTASPVAADGRIYFTSEEDGVRVIRAGTKFERLAANPLGDACLATPAISDGMIFIRTQHYLLGIGRKE